MNKAILLTSTALFLFGCAASDDSKEKEAEQQKPQFGKPESVIPWNAPTDWEKNGQLGSMPGLEGSH
ncbi:MAG TPA: hypothetical protein VE154_02220 [Chthoniobacterales bacterium]|nr:hypothetical protein [Chthoniobacterales bacterium]